VSPILFPEANASLGPPRNTVYDYNVKSVEPLPVWRDEWQCTSLWRPTLRERLSILIFGRIWLTVLSSPTQPPVSLMGSRTYFKPAPAEGGDGG